MPYYTEIPGGTVDLDADLLVAKVPDTGLLNLFGSSETFSRYGVLGGDDGTTLENGDTMSLTDGAGDHILNGSTYLGTGTLNTAAANVGTARLLFPLNAALNVSLQVNPVTGDMMQGPDGSLYMLTGTERSNARLGVTASAQILGNTYSATAPISEIANALADVAARHQQHGRSPVM